MQFTLWDPSLGFKMNASPRLAELVDALMFKLFVWYVLVYYITALLKLYNIPMGCPQ